MFKIYFHTKCIYLVGKAANLHLEDGSMYVCYDSKSALKILIDMVLFNKEVTSLYVSASDVNKLYADFCSLFKVVEAAGGVVKNKEGKLLFIFRNGKWDLPKGKIEKGEDVETAAAREVEEECGIAPVVIRSALVTTHHIYFIGKTKAIKKTYWFTMEYKGVNAGKPQLEEGISEVKWVEKKQLEDVISKSFLSIGEVMNAYVNKKKNE
ncbi:MAG: NUDIX domain-containing protein [Bacteroidetes bacterium]|nr:NUDIX domain-containing protein [Bacteroidota bacterium]